MENLKNLQLEQGNLISEYQGKFRRGESTKKRNKNNHELEPAFRSENFQHLCL